MATRNPNSTITVPVRSLPFRVAGAETVAFSGVATVTSRVDFDDVGRNPTVELLLSLGDVIGLGDLSKTRFVLSTHDVVVMPYRSNQQVEIVFALPETIEQPVQRIRTGLATFALNMDLASGAISSATVTLTTR